MMTENVNPAGRLSGGGAGHKDLSVLIAGRSSASVDHLQHMLSPLPKVKLDTRVVINGSVDPLAHLEHLPGLLVFRLDSNWEVELEALMARPASMRPALIVVTAESDPKVMRVAMQAGARDFFVEPVNPDELLRSVERLTHEIVDAPTGDDAQITVVMNAKGGSGASLIAANISHILAAQHHRRVALMDLDLQFGSLAHYLDLNLRHGIKEALDNVDDLDAIALDGYLVKHGSGLRVMGAEEGRIVLNDEVSCERLRHLVGLLARTHHNLIIDVPRQIDLITSTVLEMADQVVVVTQQSITHLRDTMRLMEVLKEDLEIPAENIKVVLNRYQKNVPISVSEVENALKIKSLVCIPNDYRSVTESLNNGIPLLEVESRAAVTRSLQELTEVVLGRKDEHAHGVLERLFARLTGE